tara:strand:+ start:361 stop:546 length:186 start_codon:yes stop_codon:yes gene_type:complete
MKTLLDVKESVENIRLNVLFESDDMEYLPPIAESQLCQALALLEQANHLLQNADYNRMQGV